MTGGGIIWLVTVSLLRSGSEHLCFLFYINLCLAVTFVGQDYLLASPKTAPALLTSILAKVCIERRKCNSEKRGGGGVVGNKGVRGIKRIRAKQTKRPTMKNNSKTNTSRGLAITAGVLQASQTTDSQTTLWSEIGSLCDWFPQANW